MTKERKLPNPSKPVTPEVKGDGAGNADEQPNPEGSSVPTPAPQVPTRGTVASGPVGPLTTRFPANQDDEDDDDDDDDDHDDHDDHEDDVAEVPLPPEVVRNDDPELLAFLRTAVEQKTAPFPLADWLRDRGDPRADVVQVLVGAAVVLPAAPFLGVTDFH